VIFIPFSYHSDEIMSLEESLRGLTIGQDECFCGTLHQGEMGGIAPFPGVRIGLRDLGGDDSVASG
jgi:hypothetical protein